MTLHELVKARLKVLYPEVTLSNARIKATADKLSAKQLTVEQETEVDAALTAMNDNGQYTFSELQKEDSRILQLQILADKGKKQDKKDEPADPQKDPTKDDDVPAWAQALIDQNKTLAEKISGFEKEKTQGSIKQQAAAKLKDIPAKYYENWQLPESEDQLDAFVEKVTTGYEGFKQDLTNQGLSIMSNPPAAGGGAPAGAGKVHPSIKAFADKEAAKQQVQKT